jgi:hypothetical protein
VATPLTALMYLIATNAVPWALLKRQVAAVFNKI